MDKRFDVTALGELLIDFTINGESAQGNPIFEANPGGAPCNVLAMLKKLGKKCAFIGKVGDDMFGRQLKETVESVGIDTKGLVVDRDAHTTLAFVKTYPGGDRDFSFYRDPGADMLLTEAEVDESIIRASRIFHFGTLSTTHEGIRRATYKAVEIAKGSGLLISFDPNLRPPLWSDLDEAREQIEWGLSKCDILKIADNEIEFLSGSTDFDEGSAWIRKNYPNITLFCITAGADGSYGFYKDQKIYVPSCRLGGTIETTGAGDTFCASVINYVTDHGLDNLSESDIRDMLTFANTAAYIVTTRKGAIKSMPERSEIEEILK